jgi:hypothetical protein
MTENGCRDTVIKRIHLYGSSNAIVSVPDTCVKTGDRFTLPLILQSSLNLDNSENYNFETKIRFNRTVLLPEDASLDYSFDGDDCIISLKGRRIPDESLLSSMKLIALLGNSPQTPVIIDGFEWTDGEETPTDTLNGNVCILNICPADGQRLFFENGEISLTPTKPNPSTGKTDIIYEVVGDGCAELFISDYLGRKVMVLINGDIKPGRYLYELDASALTTGSYFITLKTPAAIITERLEVIK